MASLAVTLCGCGSGLFGPKIYTVATGAAKNSLESPLPPLPLDETLVKPDQSALYGRVVIDGKPAEKGAVEVIAVSVDALRDPLEAAQFVPGGASPKRAAKKQRLKPGSSVVLRDDGFYLITGLRPGDYKLFCKFGTSFEGKDDETLIRYGSAVSSPWLVKKTKGQQMQDVVMQIGTDGEDE